MINDTTITNPSILATLPYNLPTIKLCFGTPNTQCFNLSPATTSTYTIIQSSFTLFKVFRRSFDPLLSSSSIDLKYHLGLPLFNNYINGIVIQDIVTILSIPHPPPSSPPKQAFTFLLMNSINKPLSNGIDGFLGLQKYQSTDIVFKHPNASFIDYLYNTSLIDKKTFALSYKEGDNDSLIEFGKKYGKYNKCVSLQNDNTNPEWDCLIEKVVIGNNSVDGNSHKVIFDSLTSVITAPLNILDLVHNEFSSKNQRHYCDFEIENHYMVLSCDELINLKALSDIHLRLEGNVDLVLQWSNLLKKIRNSNVGKYYKYISLLAFDLVNTTQWRIGLPGFINKTIVFNRKDMSIGILSSLTEHNHSSTIIILLFLRVMTFILLMGIIIVIAQKRRIMRHK